MYENIIYLLIKDQHIFIPEYLIREVAQIFIKLYLFKWRIIDGFYSSKMALNRLGSTIHEQKLLVCLKYMNELRALRKSKLIKYGRITQYGISYN